MLDKQALWSPKTLGFGIASLGRIEYIISRVSIDFGGMNRSSRAGIADMMKVSFFVQNSHICYYASNGVCDIWH